MLEVSWVQEGTPTNMPCLGGWGACVSMGYSSMLLEVTYGFPQTLNSPKMRSLTGHVHPKVLVKLLLAFFPAKYKGLKKDHDIFRAQHDT